MYERRGWLWKNVPVPEAHLGLLVIGATMNVIWPRRIGTGRPVRRPGTLLIVAGSALATWATRSAGRTDMDCPERLITNGPYAVSRHPMYVAWTLLYGGITLVSDSRWLLRFVPILLLLTHREAILEERRLEKSFGFEYRTYCARVHRYL